ncbi:hypothetical protein H6G41_09135 [Tolypothrix sp. FACHB-123]|uniref:hypothetical protein n=1 Tax=Tolypothrix sp. FACHB-123 TaxID=2692868 RepID=UPI0016845C58|nr:hypothetical protein [Tolypothrix sp. FACHB-123]MBD2354787.1 hypothetical protein [Tolypothrix sp. FACHB-123]
MREFELIWHEKSNFIHTWRLEIAATQAKPAYRAGASRSAPRELLYKVHAPSGLCLCSSELYIPRMISKFLFTYCNNIRST